MSPGWLERRWAQSDLERLAAAVEAHLSVHGSLPAGEDLGGLVAAGSMIDPWGTAYLLTGEPTPSISSFGPDRMQGTADDLVRPVRVGAAAPDWPSPSSTPPPPSDDWGSGAPLEAEVLRTQERLQTLAEALESFRRQRGHYPVGESSGLAEALVPEHLRAERFPAVDGWGRSLRYRSNDVGSSYTLVSPGSDGVFESLVPLRSGPVRGAERDLVVVDGGFVRWPSGVATPRLAPNRGSALLPASPPDEPRTAAPRAAAPSERRSERGEPLRLESSAEPGRAATTRDRLERIAAALSEHRVREGRYPELDDASRLLRLLGLSIPSQDGWGRELAYLSLNAGSLCVIASRGADGRLDSGLEDYLRGARPSGDDLVWVNGRRVE